MVELKNKDEDHGRHVCVDEYASSITVLTEEIEQIWDEKQLSCELVKEKGLKGAHDILESCLTKLKNLPAE